jgi:hypothetical protein
MRKGRAPDHRVFRQTRSGGEIYGFDRADLGAVGAVGVPSAVGISVHGEPVVDLGVVAFAEQRQVG